jgi:hypothetical protein
VLDQSAWPRVRRLLRYLEQFKGCFSSRLQQASLRRYLQGLLGDSPRKSMQAMLARVTDPGHYQAFQHFITHATWDWQPVWSRLLELLPVREGMLVIDDTSFPKQQALGRRGAPVLRGAGQDRQLSSGHDRTVVGEGPRLDPGRSVVSAERVDARPRALRARLRSAARPLSGKVTLGLDVGATRAGGGLDLHGGPRRCGLWRCHHVSRSPASAESSLRSGDFVASDGFCRDPAHGPARARTAPRPTADALSTPRRCASGRRPQAGGDVARGRVAARQLAERAATDAVARRLRRAARDAGSRLARGTSVARGVAAVPTPGRQRQRRQVFLHSSPRDHRAEATRLDRASAMGHRAAVPAAQRRTRPRSLRGANVSRLEPTPHPDRVAYTFLQQERRHTRGQPLTFPAARALVCEVFTALYFAAHPKQLDYIIQLRRHLPLRI